MWTRGIDGRAIFLDVADRLDLLHRLAEILPDEGCRCFAWAFMSNHVHFVFKTGATPVSRVMRRLHTGFALGFNRRHERQGYLFQSRFGSRAARDDAGAVAVMRYVLRNPLEAGLVRDLDALEQFPWCGYGALLGRRPALPFESVDDALSTFGSDVATARSPARVDGDTAGRGHRVARHRAPRGARAGNLPRSRRRRARASSRAPEPVRQSRASVRVPPGGARARPAAGRGRTRARPQRERRQSGPPPRAGSF